MSTDVVSMLFIVLFSSDQAVKGSKEIKPAILKLYKQFPYCDFNNNLWKVTHNEEGQGSNKKEEKILYCFYCLRKSGFTPFVCTHMH